MLQRGSACGGSSDIGSDCAEIDKKKEKNKKNKKSPCLQDASSSDFLHYLRLLGFWGPDKPGDLDQARFVPVICDPVRL